MDIKRLFKFFLVACLMYSLSVITLSTSLEAKEKRIINNLHETKKEKKSLSFNTIQIVNAETIESKSNIVEVQLEEEVKEYVSPVIKNVEEYKSVKEMNILFNNENDSFYKEYLSVEYLENGQANVCPEIRQYKNIVKKELKKYSLGSHTEFFMALLQKESGCFEELVNGDIAQASESLGLAPNTISNPSYSIQIGVEYYSNLINTYMGQDVDVRFIIHSYNFGERLIREAIHEESNYTIDYIVKKAKNYKQAYFADTPRKTNEWRPVGAEYGDLRYVANLFSIYTK